eukprot:165743-Rhodomonas_salina.2
MCSECERCISLSRDRRLAATQATLGSTSDRSIAGRVVTGAGRMMVKGMQPQAAAFKLGARVGKSLLGSSPPRNPQHPPPARANLKQRMMRTAVSIAMSPFRMIAKRLMKALVQQASKQILARVPSQNQSMAIQAFQQAMKQMDKKYENVENNASSEAEKQSILDHLRSAGNVVLQNVIQKYQQGDNPSQSSPQSERGRLKRSNGKQRRKSDPSPKSERKNNNMRRSSAGNSSRWGAWSPSPKKGRNQGKGGSTGNSSRWGAWSLSPKKG